MGYVGCSLFGFRWKLKAPVRDAPLFEEFVGRQIHAFLGVEQGSAKDWRGVEYVVSQDSVNYVANGYGQSQEGHVPRAHPPSPTARVAASFHHAARAAITSADSTTSACRGKIRSVRKSCTSGSESEQQSSTTYRL